jgi:hypothetical protein
MDCDLIRAASVASNGELPRLVNRELNITQAPLDPDFGVKNRQ